MKLFCKYAGEWPARFNAATNGCLADSGLHRPLNNVLSNAVISNAVIVRPIVRLFLQCCPPAISRFVISRVIYSVNRKASRNVAATQCHISKKVLKFSPPFADFNASLSVSFELWISWVMASLNHTAPHHINLRSGHAVRVASLSKRLGAVVDAATACRLACSKATTSDDSFCSALASTIPARVGSGFAGEVQHSPTTEFLARKPKSNDRYHGRIMTAILAMVK